MAVRESMGNSGYIVVDAFLPFSSILFSLYLYPLWSVSSKAFWTSHNSAFSGWAAAASTTELDGLGGCCDAGQMVELVYLYGNTSTHHAVTITVYSILYPKKHGGYSTYVGEKIKRGVEGGAAP